MTAKEAREMTKRCDEWKLDNAIIEAVVEKMVKKAADFGKTKCTIAMLDFPPGIDRFQIGDYLDAHGFRYEKIYFPKRIDGFMVNDFFGYDVMW